MSFERYNFTLLQSAILFSACLFVMIRGLPEISTGVLCATVFWVENIFVYSISIFWLLAPTLLMSTVVYNLKSSSAGRTPLKSYRFPCWIVAWFAWMAILWLCFPSNKWLFARNWLGYTILPSISLFTFAGNTRRLQRFAHTFIATTIFSGLLSISISFETLPNLLQNYTFAFRLFAITNDNATYFAIPFALSSLFLITFINQPRQPIFKAIYLSGFAFCMLVVILANARQVVVAISISIIIYLLLSITKKTLHVTTALIILAIVAIGYQIMQSTALQLRWLALTGGNDISAGRFVIWSDAWAMFLKSPIWGSGLDYFGDYFAHNLFLDAMAGQGIVGLVFFIGFLAFIVRSSFELLRIRDNSKNVSWSLICVCFFTFSFLQLQVTASFLYGWHFFWASALIWRLLIESRRNSEIPMPFTQKTILTSQAPHNSETHLHYHRTQSYFSLNRIKQ